MASRAQLRSLLRARRSERQRALRQPDFFTGSEGTVHPIRDSPGYDPLREREAAHEARGRRGLEEYRESQRMRDAEVGYRELQREIMAEGGIRPTVDYPAEDIPRDVRRHGGKAPDTMAAALEGRGWHFEDAESLLGSLRRRRRLLEAAGRLQRA